MLSIVLSALWELVSYNDFAIPKAAFHGLTGLVGTLSAS